jgi:S-adenosylmethionine:tRNA ribosyltransferase-isomerase
MKTKPANVKIQDFSYPLSNERIANYPLASREESKLLIYCDGNITESNYVNLSQFISEKSLMVFNNTKVIEARIRFQKPSGSSIELFCLEPHQQYESLQAGMHQKERVQWKCLIGGASKWKKGQLLEKKLNHPNQDLVLHANYISKCEGAFIIEFSWSPAEMIFAEVLHVAGSVPLPPYIKRKATELDSERYQTIYASCEGSVAAPTAGLHFTENIFEKLASKNIKNEFITLHVGAGTFQPVTHEFLDQHEMHEEWIELSASSILSIVKHFPDPIIPVGTTSIRSIESLYWLGVKTIIQPGISRESLNLGQWEAYELQNEKISVSEALNALLNWLDKNQFNKLVTKTQLLISPGYEFKIAKALVTNFHQPRSTLLLLVAALIGEDWKKVYDYALDHEFRFLSYGDGSLLYERKDPVSLL